MRRPALERGDGLQTVLAVLQLGGSALPPQASLLLRGGFSRDGARGGCSGRIRHDEFSRGLCAGVGRGYTTRPCATLFKLAWFSSGNASLFRIQASAYGGCSSVSQQSLRTHIRLHHPQLACSLLVSRRDMSSSPKSAQQLLITVGSMYRSIGDGNADSTYTGHVPQSSITPR
jgi:hypothetical protein